MGHSDASSLREIAGAAKTGSPADRGVKVWGDISNPVPSQEPASARGDSNVAGSPDPEDIYHRIGQLTRTLHDAMRELGYQERLADVRDHLPDARDRLAYIARVTGDAAEKVLNSVDRARSVQDEISEGAKNLRTRWTAVAVYGVGGDRATPAGAALVHETCEFLADLGKQAVLTNAILTEIMMAQDFHDLTGQVIRKIVDLAQTLEEQLVRLLIDATPEEQRKKAIDGKKLEGPVVNPDSRSDVIADQAGVDDLLASLGF
jgi:chemotaxis protein CheZ